MLRFPLGKTYILYMMCYILNGGLIKKNIREVKSNILFRLFTFNYNKNYHLLCLCNNNK